MWRQIIGFSPPTSTFGGIGIQDTKPENRREMFIAIGAPAQRAAQHRGADVPAAEPRACEILDHLPRNETFDWVDRVSIELTTQMLATLFDFPWEERRKLTRWSDVATAAPGDRAVIASEAARMAELEECGAYFAELWKERINQPPKIDLIF
jgi:cytochrome P450